VTFDMIPKKTSHLSCEIYFKIKLFSAKTTFYIIVNMITDEYPLFRAIYSLESNFLTRTSFSTFL
jgi:hypothetical protein